MLEVDVNGADDAPPDVVDDRPASTELDPAAVGPSPPPSTAAAVVEHQRDPAATAKPSIDADTRPRGSDFPPSTVALNNNCIRYPPIKAEVDSGSRTTEVATALAGVHSVLDRIDNVSERQQIVGDVIVHLQVLRCRLQLAQVNQSVTVSLSLTFTHN